MGRSEYRYEVSKIIRDGCRWDLSTLPVMFTNQVTDYVCMICDTLIETVGEEAPCTISSTNSLIKPWMVHQIASCFVCMFDFAEDRDRNWFSAFMSEDYELAPFIREKQVFLFTHERSIREVFPGFLTIHDEHFVFNNGKRLSEYQEAARDKDNIVHSILGNELPAEYRHQLPEIQDALSKTAMAITQRIAFLCMHERQRVIKRLNKDITEALIKAKIFDSLAYNRIADPLNGQRTRELLLSALRSSPDKARDLLTGDDEIFKYACFCSNWYEKNESGLWMREVEKALSVDI